jgi:hypothetical protein
MEIQKGLPGNSERLTWKFRKALTGLKETVNLIKL